MNIKYFQDTDTLYIEFRKGEIAETRDSTKTRCSMSIATAISWL